MVEQSHQGQLYRILRMYVEVPRGVESMAKSGANPIVPAEVVDRLRLMVMALQRGRVPELEPAG